MHEIEPLHNSSKKIDVSCSAKAMGGKIANSEKKKKTFPTLSFAVLGSQLHTHHCEERRSPSVPPLAEGGG